MNTAKWLTATGLSALSLAYGVAQAETVGINQNGSLVEMCASAEKMVMHDAAQMDVDFSVNERDKVQAADKVNRTMSQAMQLIKQYRSVTLENQSYNTSQERDSDGKLINKWQVQQSFSLTGKDLNDMAELASKLQTIGVNVSNMSSYLSPEGRRAAEQKLNDEAFADVKSRIATVAKAFGQPVGAWRIAHMNIMPNNPCSGYGGRMYAAEAMSMRAKSEDVAVPELVQGREQMRVNFYIAVRAK